MADFIKNAKNITEYSVRTEQRTININKLNKIMIETEEAGIEFKIQDTPGVEIVLETYEGGPELATNLWDDQLEIKAISTKPSFLLRRNRNCRLLVFVSPGIADNWELLTSSGDVHLTQLLTDVLKCRTSSGEIVCQQLAAKETHLKTSSGDIAFSVLENHLNATGSVTPYGDIYLSTSSGDVMLEKIQGEKLRIKTSSGDIQLHNVLVDQAILHTSSGDMTGRNIGLEKLLFTSSSGNFLIQEIAGQLQGTTSSGDVEVTMVAQAPLDIGASSGDIRVGFLSSILDGAIRVETGSGEIKNNIVMDIEKQDSHCLVGKIGQALNNYQLKAKSGDVHIYEK
ncbi:DUF4097 family beta strand repeat-containing protein [Virgibacillus sp. SK37]|uniref:DUF4097 family beta strand repeat-containing protein n=1 Tax=Virgibacillus sp. SK37 TaxID=403957 RepID=UPI0004D0C2A3|nr:DUF4097 family beta strand repeat-containing protein [Virgibacillus sp. SK37]AIF45147.1 hypothetical protein X953_02285 [Virgibacillus sp. SK37]